VIVGVRVSKSGNAIAQPGDLQGASGEVAVGADGLRIVIDQAVR
jgi:cytochrome c-type biogenesis protein CcmH